MMGIISAIAGATGKIAEADAAKESARAYANAQIGVAQSQTAATKAVVTGVTNTIGGLADAASTITGAVIQGNIIIGLIQTVGTLANTAVTSMMGMIEAKNEVKCQIVREQAMAEIEAARKEQTLEHWTKVTAAIAEYQERFTALNVSAIAALGNMSIDLRNRAHDFVIAKTREYEQLQSDSLLKAADDFVSMQAKLGTNEKNQMVINMAFETRCSNILRAASNFLDELNNNLKTINTTTDRLGEIGQKVIQKQSEELLSKFLPNGNASAKLLEGVEVKHIAAD